MTDEARLRTAFREAVAAVGEVIDKTTARGLALHNPDLAATDLREYMRLSEERLVRAVRLLRGRVEPGARVLDVGGYLGFFPLALSRLGLDVTVAERYDLYGGGLDGVRRLLEAEGVGVWDVDFSTGVVGDETFDVVLSMAMIEHIAGSPRPLMENLRRCCDGYLVLEVPNIAYAYKRFELMAGRTIHPSLASVYGAEAPFTGHHREYTRDEVCEVLGLAGFDVVAVDTFNYSLAGGWRTALHPAAMAARLLPAWREVIVALAA